MKSKADKLTFFRQSGWLVVATVASGVFMTAVHVVVNKPMEKSEYALFYTLLRVFLLLSIPAGGLQVVFARQAAAAISDEEERRLSQTTRSVFKATFLIWLAIATGVFAFRHQIGTMLKITNPAALWVTVALGLAALWSPILKGLLQGRQNFAGLGWVLILDGIGRFAATALIVELGGQAAGGMSGALVGQGVSLGISAWLVRRVLVGTGAPMEWGPWLNRVVPLTLGVGAVLLMGSADVIFVQSIYSKQQSPAYIPAAMIGLAMISFTTPLASVMFPKIVRSAARTEETDALRHALVATAVLGSAAALACSIFPELPLRIIYFRNSAYWSSAPLVPWFAWALLPLILANVLISNLLARDRFRVVPWAVAIAAGYALTLFLLRERALSISATDLFDSFRLVIGTLGVFSSLLLIAALACTFKKEAPQLAPV